MKSGMRWFDGLLGCLFVYLFVVQIWAIWPFTVDDMYITLRYARNWAAGDGLLWNTNAPPVEGYSNFSFVALGTLSTLLNFNPVIVLKSAGITGLFCTCLFLYLISRLWFLPRLAFIPCLLLLTYKGQIIWVASGLETAVYEALLCGAVYCSFRGMGYNVYPQLRGDMKRGFLVLAGFFLALAGMTRPEAPALMILTFLYLLWDKPAAASGAFRQGILGFVLVLLLFFGGYFCWRWHYYGYLFPNPIYCKGYSEFFYSIDYLYLIFIWPFALLAMIAWFKNPDRRYYLLFLPSLIYLLLLYRADPVVAFANRLFLPAFALLLPMTLAGVTKLAQHIIKPEDSYYEVTVYLLSVVLWGLFIPSMTLTQYHYFTQNPVEGERVRMEVVQWLKTNVKPGDDVVLGDAGIIPYSSISLRFIDSYCLNNKIMAHLPNDHRYEQFCHQILLTKPKVVILSSLSEQGTVTYAPADLCLNNVLKHSSDYKLRKTFSSKTQNSVYQYELFTDF